MRTVFRKLFASVTLVATLILGLPAPTAHAAIYSASRTSITGNGNITMTAGESKIVSVTFQNTSDFTWKNDGAGYVSVYTYGPKYRTSVFDPGTWLSPSQVRRISEPSVKKGETATVSFQLRAPKTTGTYSETFRLASELYAWFDGGEFTFNITVKPASTTNASSTTTSAAPATTSSIASAAQAALTVVSANKVKIVSGKSVSLTAGFKNTGTTTWTSYGLKAPDLTVASSDSSSLKHLSWNGDVITSVTGTTVKPGETAYVSFAMTAPKRNGTYTTNFQFTANGEAVDDALIEIPVEVTGGAREARTAPKSETNTEGTAVAYIPEPTMRVGVLIVDEETDDEVVITSDESDFDLVDSAGTTLASLGKGDSVTAAWNGSAYTYDVGDGTKKTAQYLRFVPKTLNAVMRVSNFDRKVTRGSSFTDNTFRNILELRHNTSKDRVWLINELSMEYYLRGLAETSNLSHIEFQKTLITAARTYAFYHWTRATKHASEFFHVDAWLDQVYKGYGQELRTPNLTKAVEATRGRIVTYQGETAITPYFSRSDGRTRTWSEVWGGSVPWCIGVSVPADAGKTLWGHGVGMSASGALAMANEGQGYDQILKYFYTGIDVTKKWE
jgi:hypothetical protein